MTGGRLEVLVLGERPLVALAAVRALGRAGHGVGVAGGTSATVPAASRWAQQLHVLPPIASQDWGPRLKAIIRRGGYDALVASTDAELARLLVDPPGIPSVPTLTSDHEPLIDKLRLAELAEHVGVAYPRTWSAETSGGDGPRGDPIIVKASRTASWTGGRLTVLPGAQVARDGAATVRAAAAIRSAGGQPILQERLVGRKLQAMIVRRARRTDFRFACEVRREVPPTHGAEVMLQRIPSRSGVGGESVAALERLADAAGYEGFVGAELLLTDDAGVVVVDVNPRLGGAIGFPELLGLRPVERAVHDVLGLDPLPLAIGAETDRYHHAVRELRRLIARPRSLPEVIGSVSRGDVWDAPAIADLRPDIRRITLRLQRTRLSP